MNSASRPRLLRWIVVLAVLLLAGGAALYGPRFFPARHTPELLVTGTMEAAEIELSPKITGRITALLVKEGDPVKAGQLLVRLDDRDLKAQVRRSEAAVNAARAQLRDLEAGSRRQEIDEARANVQQTAAQLRDLLAGARPEEIEQARQALGSATATRQLNEKEYERNRELFRRQLISVQDTDRAREAYDVAAAQERSARQQLDLLLAGPRPNQVAAARAALRAARDRLNLLLAGPRPEQVAAARAQVREAEAALAQAESQLAQTELVSPIDGVVLRKNLYRGETANPGVSILTLVNPKDIWLRAYIPEPDLGRIHVGQPVRITTDTFKNRTFPGKIIEIATKAEFTPKNVQTRQERVNLVFRIKIGVENPEGILKPGMPVDAEILL